MKRFFVKRAADGAICLMVNGWYHPDKTNERPHPLVVTVRMGSHRKLLRAEMQRLADKLNQMMESS